MTLELCNDELVGYCGLCGVKVYDCHIEINFPNVFKCPNCNKKHHYNELWEVTPDGTPSYIDK